MIYTSNQTIAICTFGESPGIALELLDREVRKSGAHLSGGFFVKMPNNYAAPPKSFRDFFSNFKRREIDKEEQKSLFKAWRNKLPKIIDSLHAFNDA